MKKTNILIVTVCLSSLGCATSQTSAAKKIREADEGRMANCKVLGTVTGSSSWGGWTASGLRESAQAEALNDAADLGATHIVWQNVLQANLNSSATGRAYLCE